MSQTQIFLKLEAFKEQEKASLTAAELGVFITAINRSFNKIAEKSIKKPRSDERPSNQLQFQEI